MGRLSCARIDRTGTLSRISKYALLVVLAGTLLGCGKGKSSSATGRFCNALEKNSLSFTAYLSISGPGVNTTWYADSGECTPCESIPAGKSLEFEAGDESDWWVQFSKVLEVGGEYEFETDLDSSNFPSITIYRPNSGYHCEDLGI